jgi:hypothetical protein
MLASVALVASVAACADPETERLSRLRADSSRAATEEAAKFDAACRIGDAHACDQAAYYRWASASQAQLAEQEHENAVAEGNQRAAAAMVAIGAAAAVGAAAARPAQTIYVVPAPAITPTHCTSFAMGSFLNTNCY